MFTTVHKYAFLCHVRVRRAGVQCTAPLFVSTKMSKLPRVPLLVPSPAEYVRAALRRVGVHWVVYDHGCLSHNLQVRSLHIQYSYRVQCLADAVPISICKVS